MNWAELSAALAAIKRPKTPITTKIRETPIMGLFSSCHETGCRLSGSGRKAKIAVMVKGQKSR